MRPSPTKPTSASAALLEHLLRDPERVEAGREPAIGGHLQEDLLDLLLAAPVAQRPSHVAGQLVGPVERAQHRDVDQAARSAVEPGPRPDRAPAVLGDELLERPAE